MCKYCEIIDMDFEVDNSLNKDSVAMKAILDWDSRYPSILMETTVYAGVFGGINIESSFNVNYCPICGRKLVD